MSLKTRMKKVVKWNQPLGLITVLAVAAGSFNIIAPSKRWQRFFYGLSWYQEIIFIIFYISAAINIFTAADFFGECLESLHFVVAGTHIFAKYLTVRLREQEFLDLFDQVREAWNKNKLHNKRFLSETLSSINVTTVIIFASIVNVSFVNVGAAYLKNILEPDRIHFPIQIWIPSLFRSNFWAGSMVQMIIFISTLMTVAMIETMLYSVSAHVEAVGLCLAKDIARQKVWDGDVSKTFYKKHQEIIKIVLRVNQLMAGNWGFEMLCSSLQLTLPAYRTLRALKRNEVEVFNHAIILCVNLMIIYLIFASGNRMLCMGEEIHARLYETDWYTLPRKEKKNVLFMLLRATKPIEYRYKSIHFDLQGFSKVVNTVVSYMALLRFLDGGEDNDGSGIL